MSKKSGTKSVTSAKKNSRDKISVIDVFFQDKKEQLDLIESGKSIIEHLTGQNSNICPLIDTKIKLLKKLGAGNYGAVFEIEFPGQNAKKYAVKKSTKFYWPITPCKTQTSYKRVDGKGETKIPVGSMICETEYAEFAISLLLGELYREGICINFMDIFAFALCRDLATQNIYQYTFMEQINSSVDKSSKCLAKQPGHTSLGKLNTKQSEEAIDMIVVQILFALAVCQSRYKIVHGDLHADNVFLAVDANMEWRGTKIGDVDYFQYIIDGQELYLPAIPIIVKIGDLGLAVKYVETPKDGLMIGNERTMSDGWNLGRGSWLPNFYTKAYDACLILHNIYSHIQTTDFISNIMKWILKLPKNTTVAQIKQNANAQMKNPQTGRPFMASMSTSMSHVSPAAILTNPQLMKSFTTKPPEGAKVLNLGTL